MRLKASDWGSGGQGLEVREGKLGIGGKDLGSCRGGLGKKRRGFRHWGQGMGEWRVESWRSREGGQKNWKLKFGGWGLEIGD